MRSLSSLLISIILLTTTVFAASSLDLSDVGVGARPLGMGKAFTSLSDDGSAIFTNPAGLAQKPSLKFISMSGSLMNEVPYTMLGISVPALKGSLGVGYVAAGLTGLMETTVVNGTPEITGNSADYSTSLINISYATGMENIPIANMIKGGLLKETKVGVTAKMLGQSFSGASAFSSGNLSGLEFDLGLIGRINSKTKAGLILKNVKPGKVLGSDGVGMTATAGLSRKFGRLTTALDVEYQRATSSTLLHLGGEFKPNKLLSIRLGLDQKPQAGSTTSNMSAGVGLRLGNFNVDYAYHTYAGLAEFNTHFVSIGFVPMEEERPKLEAKKAAELKKILNKAPEEKKAKAAAQGLTKEDKNLIAKIKKYINALKIKLKHANKPARISKLKKLIAKEEARIAAIKARAKMTPAERLAWQKSQDKMQIRKIDKYIKQLRTKLKKAKAKARINKLKSLIAKQQKWKQSLIKKYHKQTQKQPVKKQEVKAKSTGQDFSKDEYRQAIQRLDKYIKTLRARLVKAKTATKKQELKKLIKVQQARKAKIISAAKQGSTPKTGQQVKATKTVKSDNSGLEKRIKAYMRKLILKLRQTKDPVKRKQLQRLINQQNQRLKKL